MKIKPTTTMTISSTIIKVNESLYKIKNFITFALRYLKTSYLMMMIIRYNLQQIAYFMVEYVLCRYLHNYLPYGELKLNLRPITIQRNFNEQSLKFSF